ncbi:AbiJ-NTD4 domain-containing protein [Pseudomonas coleopterorum]|uniref:AbiJ-NTD4 domain-containing protein n=1 Tax=Pseudomonas coleopterorum TaxID=1605838 RepID=UPI000894D393|nr:hypothetical protein [Pseudomonas coleopterorum]SEE54509.1 hypothetical protein SAMN05216510_3082 [Pseudomonas coleopterorum]
MSDPKAPELDFSQRMGIIPATPRMQLDEITSELRNSLWNVLTIELFDHYQRPYDSSFQYVKGCNFHEYVNKLYADFFKTRVDNIPPYWYELVPEISQRFYELRWDRVYAFMEFTVGNTDPIYSEDIARECNRVLQRENSGYRFVAGKVTPITSSEEIHEIEDAIKRGNGYAGVNTHLQTALVLMSDRENPDYRNSIKESISAVESLAKQLTGNATTLAPALNELEKHHNLHPALKKAFSSLYGWTSDADGIRHCLMDVQNLTQADARFMLITCSAFINFVIDSTKN